MNSKLITLIIDQLFKKKEIKITSKKQSWKISRRGFQIIGLSKWKFTKVNKG
jgi:hypothetical protein